MSLASYGLLRAVGIIYLQSVALCLHVVADCLQRVGSRLGQKRNGLFVTVNALTCEVVGAEIAYFENDVRHHVRQRHKLAVVVSRADGNSSVLLFAVVSFGYPHAANDDKNSCNASQNILFHMSYLRI